jgi:signal transduction histidine kinase
VAAKTSEGEVLARKQRVDGARLRLLERAATATLKETLTATLDLAEELTGSQIGFFHFVEEDQVTLWLQAWSTNTAAKMCTAEGAGSHYPVDQAGVWAACVRSGHPVVHNDYASAPGRKGMPPGHAPVVRELTVPVVRGGRACAVLGVGNKSSDYDEVDVADVSSLADLAWDIAARVRAEESLRIQQTRLDLAASSGKLGLWDLDLVTHVAWRTIQHDRLFGYDELQPSWGPEDALRHVVPEDRPIFRKAFEEALVTGRFHYELRIDPAHGSRRWIEASGEVSRDEAGKPIRMAGTVADVTERKTSEEKVLALQRELAIASRFVAMGTLAAGVAHEVNNPLAAALADQELALSEVQDVLSRLRGGDPLDREAEARCLEGVVEELGDAVEGARRIGRVVKELKVFARPSQDRARERLGDIVAKAMNWLPASVHQVATVRVEDGGAPEVVASFGQIEQVVVNLVTNAAKATRPGTPGSIIVRIGPGAPGMARLDVIDQGTGIEPEILGRLFDPFFTTSEPGRGMGLGLAVCRSIVTAHGGTLTVESLVGRGSTFRMELPEAT